MRRPKTRFAITAILLLLSIIARAQKPDPPVSLNLGTVPLYRLIEAITSETGLGFSFNPARINTDTTILATYTSKPLSEVLAGLSELGIQARIMESHIILKPGPGQKRQDQANSEMATISGYISDAASGEVLIGATIGNPSLAMGTSANSYGFYSLSLPKGTHGKLLLSYVGYLPYDTLILMDSDRQIDFRLSPSVASLEEVVIVAESNRNIVSRMEKGELAVRDVTISRMPGVLGESDVIKSLQSLPGISFYSDGSTIFHVRGGDRDQNMILIDEAPVYNPAHMLGLFSSFTPESLNSVNIYRGDMPASYGGRLSSVIDVRLKDGNSEKLVFSGNTGPIATTLNLEGPMFEKHSSIFLSARRSHLKWIADANNANVDKLHFSDFNLKFNFRINRRNRILFSYYSGLDMFRSRPSQSGSSGITWVNNAGNIRWNHLFNDRLFSNTSFILSNYDYNLYTSYEDRERWNTGIALAALKSDFSWYRSPAETYRAGILLSTHFYSPGNYYVGYNAQPVTRGVSARQAGETALYISNENRVGSRLEIRWGARLTLWENRGPATEYLYNENQLPSDTLVYGRRSSYNTFASLEPRLNIRYAIRERLSARLSLSRNSQFEYLVGNSVSPFTSLETWLPASPGIRPMHANQVTAGLIHSSPDDKFITSLEAFYKVMHNYMGYVDHAHMLFNPHVETEIRYGTGRSWGAEIMVRKPSGKLSGWISYSWSGTEITIDDINEGRPWPSGYDRPHSVNLFADWQLRRGISVSASWYYSTGSPFSRPTGFYYYNGYQVPLYGERHNDRLPDYHRLDISSEFRLNREGARYKHSLRVSVLNIYGRRNPFTINFNKIIDDSGALVVPTDNYTAPQAVPSMMYLYGIIPSFSYHFEF